MIAEIIGPSGRIHYRRPVDHPMVTEARATPGYSVRIVEKETVENPWIEGDQWALTPREIADVEDAYQMTIEEIIASPYPPKIVKRVK